MALDTLEPSWLRYTIMHPLASFRNRQKPPMSQLELANRLGVHRQTVNRWERGYRQIGRGSIRKIIRETGIPVGKLYPDLADGDA